MNLNEIKLMLKAITLTHLMTSVAEQRRAATEAEKATVEGFTAELQKAEAEGANVDHTIDDTYHHLLTAIDTLPSEIMTVVNKA